jgi:hypothetical protein
MLTSVSYYPLIERMGRVLRRRSNSDNSREIRDEPDTLCGFERDDRRNRTNDTSRRLPLAKAINSRVKGSSLN